MRELAQAFGMILVLALAMAFGTTSEAADEIYSKSTPADVITKIEAMKILLTSDNKAQVYKCQLVELSTKGTVKNK